MSSLEATRVVHMRTGVQQKDQAAAFGAADPVSSPAAGSGEAAQLGQRSLAPAAHRRRRPSPVAAHSLRGPGGEWRRAGSVGMFVNGMSEASGRRRRQAPWL